jgi:hypothetical protein
MDRALILALSGWLLVASANAELQLNPKISEYQLDGAKLKQLAFSNGTGKDATYSPPRGWDYSGSANQLTLHPPNKSQAEATISRISLPEPASFIDETVKKLVNEALASVPKGSTNVQLVSQEKNPLMIERKETFLATLNYNFFGEAYGRSVLFLNRGKEQIRFRLTCRQGDFKELQKAFLASQYSWQNL